MKEGAVGHALSKFKRFSALTVILLTLITGGVFAATTSLTTATVHAECNEETGEGCEEEGTGSNESAETACYDAGVDSMSWILCPVISNGARTTNWIMDWITYWLGIPIDAAYNDYTYQAWGTVRNVANLLLICVFVVVIFSQVTGKGIDNYGIKKILPRLIAIAILINVSYVIAMVLIDASNIVGYGLYELFRNTSGVEDVGILQTVQFILLAAAGSAGTVAATVAGFASTGAPLVVMLVLAIVVVVVAVLVFFLMLAGRMIAVIALTVIAPVAVVAYALPNTQSLYQKWWNAFKTCLILYPVCGALYGFSFIVRGIADAASNTDSVNVFWGLIGVVAPFLPFFTIPTLTKSAIASLGVIGGALSGIGEKVNHSAKAGAAAGQNAIRKSAWNQRAVRDRGIKQDKKYIKRMNDRRDKAGVNFAQTPAQRERYAAAQRRVQEDERRLANENLYQDPNYVAAQKARLDNDADNIMVTSYETQLKNGGAQYTDENGNLQTVNTNDVKQVSAYHTQALEDLDGAVKAQKDLEAKINNGATSANERKEAEAQLEVQKRRQKDAEGRVKAAQNILSVSEEGQKAVLDNLEGNIDEAVNGNSGNDATASRIAATHLVDAHSATYKANGRGGFAMLQDLAAAGAKVPDANAFNRLIHDRINGNDKTTYVKDENGNEVKDANGDRIVERAARNYDALGTDKVTEQSLANTSERQFIRWERAMASGVMNQDQKAALQRKAYGVLQNSKAGRVQLKDEIGKHLESITNGYVPPVDTVAPGDILSSEVYEKTNIAGAPTVETVRKLADGRIIDSQGKEISAADFQRNYTKKSEPKVVSSEIYKDATGKYETIRALDDGSHVDSKGNKISDQDLATRYTKT